MILLSFTGEVGPMAVPLAGPLGGFLAGLVLFLMPPTGALVVVGLAPLRRRLFPRPLWRRDLEMSSRDWSSLEDMIVEEKMDDKNVLKLSRCG
jgi:hypothetical protein